MGIPLLEGRSFDGRDRARDRRVAVVSQLAAVRMWPGQNPIGRKFFAGNPGSSPIYEVIGVAGDVKGVSLNEDVQPTVYEPYWQRFFNHVSIVLRTAGDATDVSPSVRSALQDLDGELPIPPFRPMTHVIADSVEERKFQMSLILLFGLVALMLASIGVYGVVSYSVTQRTNEVGLRIALGADSREIARIVLRQAMRPVMVGVGVGLVASIGAGDILRATLFGVTPSDPVTLVTVAVTLVAVGFLASYLPARRAMRVDPLVALRYE
jgi:putative ABC transport system permease protein